jgi:hypothetical protein
MLFRYHPLHQILDLELMLVRYFLLNLCHRHLNHLTVLLEKLV